MMLTLSGRKINFPSTGAWVSTLLLSRTLLPFLSKLWTHWLEEFHLTWAYHVVKDVFILHHKSPVSMFVVYIFVFEHWVEVLWSVWPTGSCIWMRAEAGLELIRRDDGEMSPQGLHLTPSQYPKGRRKDGNYSLWQSNCVSLENDRMKSGRNK